MLIEGLSMLAGAVFVLIAQRVWYGTPLAGIAAAAIERERIIRLLQRTEFTSLDHMPHEAALMIRMTAPGVE